MNNLGSILKQFQISQTNIEINNVQWLTQDSNKNSILFYHFNNNSNEEISHFKQRIGEAEYALCITNASTEFEEKNIYSINASDFSKLLDLCLNALYSFEQEQIKFLGVTGTNGKTTTVDIARQLLLQQGKTVLSIGTLGIILNNDYQKSFSLTTPSYIDLHKTIAKYAGQVEFVLMELSSHALEQKRFGNITFEKIGWTNLSQDHLDYHGTMDGYLNAKLKVFEFVNNDADVILPKAQETLIQKIDKAITKVDNVQGIKNPFFKAEYNLENLALALGLINDFVKMEELDLENIKAPAGRFNIIKYQNSYIIIDYAHTPDALLAITSSIKKDFSDYSLITVFGCGGDRDKTKRPLMGAAASKHSDLTVITSDNPRFEAPMDIINHVLPGIDGEYEIFENREEAIKFAISKLSKSVLLIAGKGHEEYIDSNGIKIPYNDLNFIKECTKDSFKIN